MTRFFSFFCAASLAACQAKQVQPVAAPLATPVSVEAESAPVEPEGFPGLKFYKWQLVKITSPEKADPVALPEGVPAERFHMSFDQKGLSIRADCNMMFGYLEMKENKTFKLDAFRMTQKGCGHPRDQADDVIANSIFDANRYRVTRASEQYHLRLSTAAGVRFDFIGLPTLELKYGDSTRRFIEIVMSREPCPEKPCLKWREYKYEEDYSQTPVSESWQTKYKPIQGFSPEPNTNYGVRIREYQTPDGPLWVHDMTVRVEVQEDSTP